MRNNEREDDLRTAALTIIDSGYPEPLWDMVKGFSLRYLEKGRIGWDVPHTKSVVNWVFLLATDYNRRVENGEISEGSLVDVSVLVTAAWLHDIGYHGEFGEEARLDQVMDKKAKHMVVGADMAKTLLEENATDYLNREQISQVVKLISVHDDLENITSTEEAILLEADTLGAIDVSWVEPTYRGDEALEYLSRDRAQKRYNLFRTPLGTESLSVLIGRFEQFIIDRDFGGISPK